jgi:hypothetical protein
MDLELGILIADDRAELPSIERPEATQLFLMDEGVRLASDARIVALVDAGLEATVCATDAEARHVVPPAGVRLGSQYDHATMIRDARTIIALTGAARDLHVPGAATGRIAAVSLTREPRHPKIAQGLRSAVAYAACGLDVRVVVHPAAGALLRHDDHPPAVVRALATLRGLGHRVIDAGQPFGCHVEVRW